MSTDDAVDDAMRAISAVPDPGNARNTALRKYEVPLEVGLAAVFRAVLAARDELGVVGFTVSQATLEDVFLSFAKEQACD